MRILCPSLEVTISETDDGNVEEKTNSKMLTFNNLNKILTDKKILLIMKTRIYSYIDKILNICETQYFREQETCIHTYKNLPDRHASGLDKNDQICPRSVCVCFFF